MTFDQAGFDVRCEWGIHGNGALAGHSDVVVIVDVLSFSTCVEIATARGAQILPYRWKDDSARAFAERHGAELARARGHGGFSLSPGSFLDVAPGARVVLPSPNGASLTLATGGARTLTGCLRNAGAVAAAAARWGRRVAVIPAGEWWPDGSLRPCLEDWLGAGAVIDGLSGSRSPEAQAAAEAFRASRADMRTRLLNCGSGRELAGRGYEEDVILASELNASACVPQFVKPAYVNTATD